MEGSEEMMEAIEGRHSVRSFIDRPLSDEHRAKIQAAVDRANAEGDLDIRLVCDESTAFSGTMARYGKFSGVRNYLVCAGKKAHDLDRRVGYYGEQVVLYAQTLGLNTCWVGLTYSKGKIPVRIDPGEKLVIVIALGYGESQGAPRKTKPIESLHSLGAGHALPAWFEAGLRAAQLAPTAMNQQKFSFGIDEAGCVSARAKKAFYSQVDLGIACAHFEIGACSVSSDWSWAGRA